MPDISALSGLSMFNTVAARSTSTQNTSSTQNNSSTQDSTPIRDTVTVPNTENVTNKSAYELTMADFYTLLATQIQYQDADNPMDTSEMMNQLVQNQMSEAITQMSTAVSDLTTVNLLNYSASMMGKEVTLAEVNENGSYTGEETKGVVTGVTLGSSPSVVVNGKEYSIVQIMGVGQVPEETDPEQPGEGGSGGSDGSDATEGTGTV